MCRVHRSKDVSAQHAPHTNDSANFEVALRAAAPAKTHLAWHCILIGAPAFRSDCSALA